ncbi:MAG: HD domain-containing protein [Bacillota bacterium]
MGEQIVSRGLNDSREERHETERVRDPIHGMIEYNDAEQAIINSPAMQRLRGIKQLALTEYVYPGAKHSRFEHSLGTMHVAGRIANKPEMGLQEKEIQIIRLAALLHDVGHGPFSHVAEECLEKYSKLGKDQSRQEIHEKITADIIRMDPVVVTAIKNTKIDPEEVAAVISHGTDRTFATDIVSGPVDADKLDYLLRDSYYAGVKYGVYDLERIIGEAKIIGNKENLAFAEGAMWALEQLLLARHHMFTQVYQHRIRLISDAMIVRGLTLAAEEDSDIKHLFEYNGSKEFLASWQALDDEAMFRRIAACSCTQAKAIFDDLKHRRLYKRIARVDLAKDITNIKQKARLVKMDAKDQMALEKKIAEALGLDDWKVIASVTNTNKPGFRRARIEVGPSTIFIVDRNGEPVEFGGHPDALAIFPEYREILEVYVPVVGDTAEERKAFRAQAEAAAWSIIKEYGKKVGAK